MTVQDFPADTTPSATGGGLDVAEPELDQWQQDLQGLLLIGHLEGSFDFCGHRIAIRTLTTDEELIVGAVIREWQDTIAATKAYAAAMIALAVQSIDGQPMPSPIGETGSRHQWAVERFRWAKQLYPWTIDAIYTQYMELEARVKTVLEHLGKASDPGESAIPGSSTRPGSPSDGGS